MNNRTQQRFDKSIREAVEATRKAQDAKPRRAVVPLPTEPKQKKPRGRLYLDPITGATVWEPK